MTTYDIDSLLAAQTADQWSAQLLADAASSGLSTTSWQSGGVVRTLLAICAQADYATDAVIALAARGGFLDFAADPTVTADPSVTPGVESGWLDLLASSGYNVTRAASTFATGTAVLTNTSATPYGPYSALGYHLSNPATSATYANTAALTIAAGSNPSTIASATTDTPIKITTNPAHGLATGAYVTITGVTQNTAANGTWQITWVSNTEFTLNGSVGTGLAPVVTAASLWLAQSLTVAADVAGSASTAAPGTITGTVTSLLGVTATNLVSLVGANAESNTALAERCRLKLASLSPNGPADSYHYFALQASTLLAAMVPPVTLTGGPITRALVAANALTGTVTTTVANAAGDVAGVSGLTVTGATWATPIVVTTSAAHGLNNNDYVTISGVLGNTAANGTWQITAAAGVTFTLVGSAGNAAYTSGGTVEGGDLGQVDRILQANAVPLAVTALAQSATALPIPVTADVWAPAAVASTISALVSAKLAAYFAALPIGGLTDPGLAYTNIVPLDALIGQIFEASTAIVQVTLAAPLIDTAVGPIEVPVLGAVDIRVHAT